MNNFVFYRTYSREVSNKDNTIVKESWEDTVNRAATFSIGNHRLTKSTDKELLINNMLNYKQFLSGRTLWIGGTPLVDNMANFNCGFLVMNDYNKLADLIYAMMLGVGIGCRILKEDVKQLPAVYNHKLNIIYKPTAHHTYDITVEDSKEGWRTALIKYFKIMTNKNFKLMTNKNYNNTITINLGKLRAKGAKLNTFGGTSSGPEALEKMFKKIHDVITSRTIVSCYLKTIDLLDIINIIGENVVSGGVRRTAEILLIDSDDTECLNAKSNIESNSFYTHRYLSNNTVYYNKKPTKKVLKNHVELLRTTGEPGFINMEQVNHRAPHALGVNPCAEILLTDFGLCNLTTVNVAAFVTGKTIDIEGLLEAQRLSAEAGYRMTKLNLNYPMWNNVQKEHTLLGCSLTGWQDMVNLTKMSMYKQKQLLKELKDKARHSAKCYAYLNNDYNFKNTNLITTIKPEGTLSLLAGVSSGVHYHHSEYYIRRIRINALDPLVGIYKNAGYKISNEVGQTDENCITKVIDFPVKAPKGKTKDNISAIKQLKNYKLFMKNYVDHNCSITITVKPNEWKKVTKWLYKNWSNVIAITLIALDNIVYDLAPLEKITAQQYYNYVNTLDTIPESLLQHISTTDLINDYTDCNNNVCPVR